MVWQTRVNSTKDSTKEPARGVGVLTAVTTQVAHIAKDVATITIEKRKNTNVKLAIVILLALRVCSVTKTADAIVNLE